MILFSLSLHRPKGKSQIYLHLILRRGKFPTKNASPASLFFLRQEAIERKIKIYRIVYCLEMSARRDRSETIRKHTKKRNFQSHPRYLCRCSQEIASIWVTTLPNSSFTYEYSDEKGRKKDTGKLFQKGVKKNCDLSWKKFFSWMDF